MSLKCHRAIKLGISPDIRNRNLEFKRGCGQEPKFEKHSLAIEVITEPEAVGSVRKKAKASSVEKPLFKGPGRMQKRAYG